MHRAPFAARPILSVLQGLAIGLFLLIALSASAQVAGTGSIQGTVTDSTGAVMPNADVTLISQATHVTRNAKTNGGGTYSFPNIDVGTYSVSVGTAGFETYTQTGIALEVGSSISIDVKMTVGSATEKIEVKSTSLALQTEDVSFKQTIDQATVTEMPLNGRQMTSLITLSGGSSNAPGGDMTGSKYSYAGISVSIAGGNGNTTSWKLDGGDNNDWMANTNLPFPFPDAVAQFSVESTALGALGGIHSGGLVNVVTRSGTNTYHGSAFEFIRNNIINATGFFSATKDQLRQHQFGGTFGGPVRIPRLYNGTDKLFFFVGYQFQRTASAAANQIAHLPTTANLAGDFSLTDPLTAVTGGCPQGQQLYDPITGAQLVGNKYPTGQSPTWDPAALALLKSLPTSTISDNCGTVSFAIPNLTFDKQLPVRVDYAINANNNLYARYFLDGYQVPTPYSPTLSLKHRGMWSGCRPSRLVRTGRSIPTP